MRLQQRQRTFSRLRKQVPPSWLDGRSQRMAGRHADTISCHSMMPACRAQHSLARLTQAYLPVRAADALAVPLQVAHIQPSAHLQSMGAGRAAVVQHLRRRRQAGSAQAGWRAGGQKSKKRPATNGSAVNLFSTT